MRPYLSLLTTMVAFGGVRLASGEPPQAPRGGPPDADRPMLRGLFQSLDANGDGVIDKQEFASRAGNFANALAQRARHRWRMVPGRWSGQQPGPPPWRGGWGFVGPREPAAPSGGPGAWGPGAGRGPGPAWSGPGKPGQAFGWNISEPIRRRIEQRIRQIVREELRRCREYAPRAGPRGPFGPPEGPSAPAFRPPRAGRGQPAPYAQEPAPRPPRGKKASPGRGRPVGPRGPAVGLRVLDLNGDGAIDAKEAKLAPQTLRKLDANNDGRITPDELRRPQRAPGKGGPKRPCRGGPGRSRAGSGG